MDTATVTQTAPETQPKTNNFIQYQTGQYIIQRIKYLIAFQTFLGVNRLYLLGCRNCVKNFCFTYSAVLVLTDAVVITLAELYSVSQLLFKNTIAIEYLLLAFCAFTLQRKPLRKFFSKLQDLDERLNICTDINLTTPANIYIYGTLIILMYYLIEQFLYYNYAIEVYGAKYSMYASYLGVIAHDMELIFFSVLLVMISRRLRVIKAHVAKLFSMDIENNCYEELNKLEALSKKANLDVTSVHNAYDTLYKSSMQLAYAMTIPITVMLVASGLSTILTLKNLIRVLQDLKIRDEMVIRVFIVISFGRSLKYILLLMLPCYLSTATKTQVDIIRALLHDILNSNSQLDKVSRRKLKALSQLCCDNAFVYELWGVLRLDMTLPLAYFSLCVTYLIIVVQFSKFID